MKKIDIKQIILDVITMHEDPDLECLHEEDYEEFADEVEKRIKNHGVSHHVSNQRELLNNFSSWLNEEYKLNISPDEDDVDRYLKNYQ